MSTYTLPEPKAAPAVAPKTALLIASGDLRPEANRMCWEAQAALEREATEAFEQLGWTLQRANEVNDEGHGFIGSQKHGMEVFRTVHPKAPLVVAEAVWQYSAHVLHGLLHHEGPILVLANWSGQWPGLVGALNLTGSLTKAGKPYSFVWADDFRAPETIAKLRRWVETRNVDHDLSHVVPLDVTQLPPGERRLGEGLAQDLREKRAIFGIFDEGCMGMYNAIIPDHLLVPMGIFKERMSQATLYHAMMQVPDEEARAVKTWLDERGVTFVFGRDEATELTERQVLEQCKMYVAALRLADETGCDVIGIQYQLGLTELVAASDLAEGMLNNADRPPVRNARGEIIRDGKPMTHFNEVDECSGLDGLMTQRVFEAMGLPSENTLHDIRWGASDESGTTDEFVWVFEISGAAPPAHFKGGYAGTSSERQPPMYFKKGGGSMKGISKPGEVVWSRIYVDGSVAGGKLVMDIGRCASVDLPDQENHRRWNSTTPQWPIMNAVTYGVSRDQLMAKHKANHVQVVYAPDEEKADRALAAKAAMAHAMGIEVNLCGNAKTGRSLHEQLARYA